jgi:hypothetical protein
MDDANDISTRIRSPLVQQSLTPQADPNSDDETQSIQSRFDSPISLSQHEESDLLTSGKQAAKQSDKIAFLTSGGDSQGMNAAIRAIVRTAIAHKCHPIAVYDGFNGLIGDCLKESIREMNWDDVAFILSEVLINLMSLRVER